MFNFETLKTTLQDSIFTWDYFTDFEKVKTNVKKIEKELNLLNYLIGKENIEEEFLSLIEEYPKVRKILPILIAIRDDKLSSTPIITNMETLIPESRKYIFNDEINEKISHHSGFDPVTLKIDVPPEIVTIIEEQQDLYPGVFIDTKPVRNYIYKYEGAHALGYVSEISDSELKTRKKLVMIPIN